MSKISDIIFAGQPHKITSPYGPRNGSFHYGTDYGTYLKNLPQYAIEDGEVYSAGYEKGGAGYYIWVKYPRINKRFLHCHLQKASPLKKGECVTRGTLVGYTGTTGNSTGIHLHLGVRDLTTNAYEDPELFARSYTDPIVVQPLSDFPVQLQVGYASPGDIRTFETLLDELAIDYSEGDEGYIVTDIPVSDGDQISIVALGSKLGVPVVVYEEEPVGDIAVSELKERISELETDKLILKNRVELKDKTIVEIAKNLEAVQSSLQNMQAALETAKNDIRKIRLEAVK